jgi:hypothetical protein
LLPIRLRPAATHSFPDLESRNFNNLVLIRFCLARAMRAGASPYSAARRV